QVVRADPVVGVGPARLTEPPEVPRTRGHDAIEVEAIRLLVGRDGDRRTSGTEATVVERVAQLDSVLVGLTGRRGLVDETERVARPPVPVGLERLDRGVPTA